MNHGFSVHQTFVKREPATQSRQHGHQTVVGQSQATVGAFPVHGLPNNSHELHPRNQLQHHYTGSHHQAHMVARPIAHEESQILNDGLTLIKGKEDSAVLTRRPERNGFSGLTVYNLTIHL
ncbi:unnamed protein product [Protopolystoma xenopodis]|uniref:Uncharacterized protein n=1 Tax=Protopolystoma xenopodis TaxID=117903 RepID=A0A448XDA0_9PLAT|nr:unnamed protein product [Protopolystoma xenopodis]